MAKTQLLSARWLTRAFTSLFLVVVFVLAQVMPGIGLLTPPAANAQTGASCHYRVSGYLDTSLCWIELTTINKTSAGAANGQRVTIQIDSTHTMSFTVKYNQGNTFPGSIIGNVITKALPLWSGGVMGNTINGTTYYKAPTGVPASTPMAFYSSGISGTNQVNPQVELRDIVVRNSSGFSPSFGMVIADAESTNSGENITMLSDTGVSVLGKFTPSGYTAPCANNGPSTVTGTGGSAGVAMSGLRCNGIAGNVGMLLGQSTNPTNIKVELNSPTGGLQGVSFAVLMGGAKGTVATDQKADQGLTTKTNFNMEMAIGGVALGSTVTTTGTAVSSTSGTFLLDSTRKTVTFKSTPTTNVSTAWLRYTPTWTCTVTGSTGTTVSRTPTITQVGNTSQAGVTVNAGETANCDVLWVSKFDLNATLDLGKFVIGSASTYSPPAGTAYTLAYVCTPPTGFAAAYPGYTALTGSVSVTDNQRKTVSGLPVGASCVITETSPYTDRSTSLVTGWTTATTKPTTTTAAASHTVTLVSGTNSVAAVNQYTPVMGDLIVTKQITGTARSQFRTTAFQIEYRCQDDTAGVWKPVNLPAVGSDDTETITLSGVIPVGRNCQIREVNPPTAANTSAATIQATVGTGTATTVTAGQSTAFTVPVPTTVGVKSSQQIKYVNKYDWNSVAVSLASSKLGTARDLYTGDFGYDVVCTLNGANSYQGIVTIPAASVGTGYSLTNSQVTPTGAGTGNPQTFQAPPGSLCKVTLRAPASTAIAALAPTGGPSTINREPYTYFLDNNGNTRVSTSGTAADGSTNMTTNGVSLNGSTINVGGTVGDAWKTHSYSFVVPAPVDSPTAPVYRVSAAHVYNLDARDVIVNKVVQPESVDAGNFNFTYTCGPANNPSASGTATIADGENFTIKQVPVNSSCSVSEDLGDNQAGPITSWATGAPGANPATALPGEIVATTDGPASRTTFSVPTTAVSDTTTTAWQVTATNRYAVIDVEKTITGGGVSSGQNTPLDTAVLGTDQTSMTITYTVTNNGPFAFKEFVLSDPSLQGYTLTTVNGQPVTLGTDGRLNGLNCAQTTSLEPGASITCQVIAQLEADTAVNYRGAVNVIGYVDAAAGRGLQATDEDTFGALRMPAAVFGLPITGGLGVWGILGGGAILLLLGGLGYFWMKKRDSDS
ncbi:DUF5979 domain-containing protein [Corynebacterium callunae]|uniref:DUF5979 domain-containing protein n=1 Tax=Corynebacterium callunae TaxID=1721 RepID=UPI003981FA56